MDRRIAQVYGWLLVMPAVVLLALFTHMPAVRTVVDSFFSTPRGRIPARFVGLDHYQRMFLEDPVFMKAVWNNFLYALGTIPTSMALAILMALWVNARLPGRGFVRMAYFTPTVLPMVAAANIWLFFYTPGYGLLNQLAAAVGLPDTNFLGSPDTVLWSLMVVTVWKEAGFFMIFYLAALQAIPPSLEEAARLEGSGPWHYFRRVQFPLLMPTTLFVLVNAVIGAFRVVDHVVAMTGGGPNNASSLLLYYIYETGFRFWDSAYAAALTVVLLAVLALVAIGQFALLDRKVHYR
ncbi:sugar ABC transporter permease [Geminicoccaceae bacterium 1502E]|nr:sugar ABC transporter permease [Geminicoccaceae bacterium 1502E]